MRKSYFMLFFTAFALNALAVSPVQGDYLLVKDVLGTSGGHLESSGYLLDFSTGQVAVGQSQGSGYIESGGFWSWEPWGIEVAVEEGIPETHPGAYVLSQNYPNPFNPQTHIVYHLPQAGQVTLMIYNVRGQAVRRLVGNSQGPGEHVVTWDGLDETGRSVSSGIYFYQLVAGEFREVRKMLLLK